MDAAAFEIDPMIYDDYDEFVMNVLEQDKSTGKPNQITIITNGEEYIGTKTKLRDESQVPTGPAARAPGGDQVLFEQISQPNQLQLGAVNTGTILSMVTGPTQGESVREQAGLAKPKDELRERPYEGEAPEDPT